MPSLVDYALQLLKEKQFDELESELHKVAEAYRFAMKVKQAAEESAIKLTAELERLNSAVISLELDKEKLLHNKMLVENIVQQQVEKSNADAQLRMQEISNLRSLLHEKEQELEKLRE